jgi:multisubunit Na+/H+ antiporter MnhC subunit
LEIKKQVYVGEAKNLYNRLKTHNESPEEKCEDWNKGVIINDGRSSNQSDFNDTVVRRTIEYYLINLFKMNKYKVLAQGEPQKLNASQKTTIDAFWLTQPIIIAALIASICVLAFFALRIYRKRKTTQTTTKNKQDPNTV